MKTIERRTLGLAVAMALLAGCGGGGSDSVPDTSSSASSSSSDGSSSQASSSSAPGNGWTLVWSDEFDGDSLDTGKWSHEVNCAGGGNNELQCYTDRSENSYVEDGMLHLVARQERFSGPALFDDDPAYDPDDTSVTRDYTSARLRTKHKGDWTYGRIEVRAQTPEGQGLWPAIWMLPTDNRYGGWPLSGEIDIFEAVNTNATGGNTVHGTLHYGREWPNNLNSGTSYTPAANIWEHFHTYAVEWEAGEIRWYVDDHHFATQTQEGWFTFAWNGQEEGFHLGEGAAPFDQAFHLILNIAVGGDWPGAPNAETRFPQQMRVDYVRVYECSDNPETGKGCATEGEGKRVAGHPARERIDTLYENGPSTLAFSVFDSEVTNTLEPGLWQETSGNIVSEPNVPLNDQTVWEVQFNGISHVLLRSGDMSDVPHVESGLVYSVDEAVSAINFDLRVLEASGDAALAVKVDSGWPNVSTKTITLPGDDAWHNVSVRLSDLEPNAEEPGEVDYRDIVAGFVLEATAGTAQVQLNNIRLSCLGESCGVGPKLDGTAPEGTEPLTVFSAGALGDAWSDPGVSSYTQDGQSVTSSVVNDAGRGDVLQVGFGDSGFGTVYIQGAAQDLSAYAAGQLVFDLKVVDAAANTSGFVVKADCIYPCSSNELAVPMPVDNQWTTVTVSLEELATGSGFRFDSVDTPFSFWPVVGEQANVVFLLDNIRWEASGQ